ncbi:hypothetical protein AAVH_12510 [Aphelenchoides avenae]|nr:hypothetical protein AAVH_12510 [Aphelenchus avenae]
MRAILRLNTVTVGRIPPQGFSQAFGGLPPHQNCHFVRENVRYAATKAARNDKTHKADLVLDVSFKPTTYPAGCDKGDYRDYFKQSKVYILGGPKSGDISETIRGLRPDAVVVPMDLPSPVTRKTDLSPKMIERALLSDWPKEFALAYKAAKALPSCTVVCEGIPMRVLLAEGIKFIRSRPKINVGALQRMREVDNYAAMSRSEMLDGFPGMRELSQKLELHVVNVLLRTLNERASDELEPVRIVAVVKQNFLLEGIEEKWQTPHSSGSLGGKIVVGIALLFIVYVLVKPNEHAWGNAASMSMKEGKSELSMDDF